MAMLDRLDLHERDHNAADTLHAMAQAFRLAFVDRFAYLADPDHVDVPLDVMLSSDYIAERAALVQAGVARPDRGRRRVSGWECDTACTDRCKTTERAAPQPTSGRSTRRAWPSR